MAQRDELFRCFGPRIIEAFMLVTLDETNRLRAKLNMPAVNQLDVLLQLQGKLSMLEPYVWEQDPINH